MTYSSKINRQECMKELKKIASNKISSNYQLASRPIVDVKRIRCIGGKGGDGALAFSKHGPHRLVGPGLPMGGAGGRGGNVYVAPILYMSERTDLRTIPGTVRASNGLMGGGSRSNGNPGEDYIIRVPLGTLVYKFQPSDNVINWRLECRDWKRDLIADINSLTHEKILLASGGRGGMGNNLRNPYEAESGSDPEVNYYEMELKSIADIGLLGLPNVGKSTLLASEVYDLDNTLHSAFHFIDMPQITRATPRIAAYPFTTISPFIGHVKYTDDVSLSVADMPGIVECHLTQEFLRHVERTKALLYVIDVCNPTMSPFENFSILRKQVEDYGSNLSNKPYTVVMTKMDVASQKSAAIADEFYKYITKNNYKCNLIPISAKLGLGITNLVKELRHLVSQFDTLTSELETL